ncbi:MAG: hypothetical protein LEGION0398_MBIBDBAK_01362 [Legionellaceae bacterium]
MQKLNTIETLRGIAALLVVVFHATQFTAMLYSKPLHNIFMFGYAGVEFFFVLSGFIIFYSHSKDIGNPSKISIYLKKRFIRIFPLFWLITLCSLIINYFVPIDFLVFTDEPIKVLKSLSLYLQEDREPVLGVAWTLKTEVYFYLIFALLILNRKLGAIILIFWTFYNINAITICFLLGFFANQALNLKIKNPKFIAYFGIILFLSVGIYNNHHTNSVFLYLYDIASVLIITGFCHLEMNNAVKVPAFLTRIGSATYSIYLMHYGTMAIISHWKYPVITEYHLSNMYFFILIISGIISGLVVNKYIEIPLLNYLRKKLLLKKEALIILDAKNRLPLKSEI